MYSVLVLASINKNSARSFTVDDMMRMCANEPQYIITQCKVLL